MSKASVYFILSSMDGKHDVKEIKQELDSLPGVLSVSVDDDFDRVCVDFDTTGIQCDRLEEQLEELGYEILDYELDNHIM